MLITNDVALITFVPFTILVYQMVGKEELLLKLVVLETIAANLGSMGTPIEIHRICISTLYQDCL